MENEQIQCRYCNRVLGSLTTPCLCGRHKEKNFQWTKDNSQSLLKGGVKQ